MGISRRFLLIYVCIISSYVSFGVIKHMVALANDPHFRERYVLLPEDALTNDPQLSAEGRETELPLVSSDTGGKEEKGSRNYKKKKCPTLDPSQGLHDKSRTFQIHPFAVVGEEWSNVSRSWQICLSTQTSTELLFWVQKQAEMWEGPLSVSVFTPDVDYTIALKMINYMQTCFPEVETRVTFHMIYPIKFPPIYVPTDKTSMEYDCEQPESVNKVLVEQIRTKHLKEVIKKTAYPQNLLRNVAREGCHSDYSFTPDIDMISIPGMSRQLNEFTSRNTTKACKKCAFVIPTYEIHTGVKVNPVDKNELKTLLKKRMAQRFHVKAFAPNQANSRLQEWEKSSTADKLDVLYNITSWRSYWEPIYITQADVPLYDERFVGYGFTRSSQVFEMHVNDYSWHMLNNVFLCHRGFQTSKGKSSIRKYQIFKNGRKYKIFRKELYARYGKKEEDYEPKKKKVKKKEKENPHQDPANLKPEAITTPKITKNTENGSPKKLKNT